MISFDTRTQADMISRALPEYTVFPPLESGSQGLVFLGEHHASHRAVAVKVLGGGSLATRAQRARFEREIETLFRLDHPNIVRTYESGSIEGRLFYVMQWVDGPPITDFVLSYDLSLRQIVELFQRVCDGLSYAHGCGVIHRDIKPGNILIQDDDGPRHGTPYVVDFGLAKVLTDREGAFRTQADSPLGTPAYMSPEQIDGRGRMLDVRSDIYSLGVVMYEVLSCEHFPYRVDVEFEQVRRNILNRTPTPLRAANPAVDADLSTIVGKCLEKDRALRYRSVDELADDLRRWQRGDAVEARKQHRWYRFHKALRKHRWPLAAASTIVLLLGIGAASTTFMWQRAERLAATYRAGLEMGEMVRLGSVARDDDRVDDALAMWQHALRLSETAPLPDESIDRMRYEALHRLAEFYLVEKNPEVAGGYCAAAVEIAESQVAALPDDLHWHRRLAFAEIIQGRLRLACEDCEGALAAFTRAADIRTKFVTVNPGDVSHRARLAVAQSLQGRACRRLHRAADAWDYYRSAYQIRYQLWLEDPESVDRTIDLVQAEAKLVLWHISADTPEDDRLANGWLSTVEQRLAELQVGRRCDVRPRDCRLLNRALSGYRRELVKRTPEAWRPEPAAD